MTRSPLASFLFKGLATKHITVKWTIEEKSAFDTAEGYSLDNLQLFQVSVVLVGLSLQFLDSMLRR